MFKYCVDMWVKLEHGSEGHHVAYTNSEIMANGLYERMVDIRKGSPNIQVTLSVMEDGKYGVALNAGPHIGDGPEGLPVHWAKAVGEALPQIKEKAK